MEHIDDKILEKLFLCPDELSSQEKDDIASHIENCSLCSEHATKLKQFYKDLQTNLDTPPTERDEAFAEKLLVPKGWMSTRKRLALPTKAKELPEKIHNALSTFVEIIEPYHRPLAQRFIRYIFVHPIRVAGGFSLAAALVFATLMIRPMFKDTNPSYARAKDEFLVVYNKNGDELWRKHIGPQYDMNILLSLNFELNPDDYLKAVDVNRDGKKEIIAFFSMIPVWNERNTIYCFSSEGTVLWKYQFNRKMIFGKKDFHDQYFFRYFMIDDFDKDDIVDIITVISHDGWYPTAIIKLNAFNGQLTNEYWHSGNIHSIINKDINNDGTDEIIAIGENNGYNLASVVVLDSRNFNGHAPTPYDYKPQNIDRGNELYYLLIERSDLKHLAIHKRNRAKHIRFTSNNLFLIDVHEEIDMSVYTLLYFFNNNMKCVQVDGEDKFVTYHIRQEKEEKLTKKIDAQYYEELREGIKYWDKEKFEFVSFEVLFKIKRDMMP